MQEERAETVADEVLAPDAPSEEEAEAAEPGGVRALVSGDTQWVRSTAGAAASAQLVRTDRNGNSYMVMTYGAGTSLQGVPLPGTGGFAVASHTPTGALRWLRAFSCTGAEDRPNAFDLWVTPGGRSLILLDGPCTGDFGAGPISGRALLLVLGNGGQHRWSRALVGSQADVASLRDASVTVSPTTQAVLVAAELGQRTIVEGVVYDTSPNVGSLYLRYTDRGTLLGRTLLRDPRGNIHVEDVAYDNTGRLNAQFTFNGTVDFGDGPRVANGNAALLLARYQLSRRLRWARHYPGDFIGLGLATLGNRVVAVGSFLGELRFRGRTFSSIPDPRLGRASQGFVLALRRDSGGESWLQLRGRSVDDVDINVGDGVVTAGRFQGVGPVPPASFFAKFVGKYDRLTGRSLWRRVLDFDGDVNAVAITPSQRVLACGSFASPTDFGTGVLTPTPPGNPQAFLMRMDP
ncbi:MAG TPA: hypothetical protein VFO83_03445 [Aggregicoccus sp.]|nr:hypothetical protein [Aggregicoccus sp.]